MRKGRKELEKHPLNLDTPVAYKMLDAKDSYQNNFPIFICVTRHSPGDYGGAPPTSPALLVMLFLYSSKVRREKRPLCSRVRYNYIPWAGPLGYRDAACYASYWNRN